MDGTTLPDLDDTDAAELLEVLTAADRLVAAAVAVTDGIETANVDERALLLAELRQAAEPFRAELEPEPPAE